MKKVILVLSLVLVMFLSACGNAGKTNTKADFVALGLSDGTVVTCNAFEDYLVLYACGNGIDTAYYPFWSVTNKSTYISDGNGGHIIK